MTRGGVDVTPAPTADEAAAIAAALGAFLADEAREVSQERDGSQVGWDGDRWTFAGRLSMVRPGDREGGSSRPPREAPRDPWTASGRTERF